MSRQHLHFIVLLSIGLLQYVSCDRVLAITPTICLSHFEAIQPLLLELVKRGHQVTVVSNFPQKTPITNYTDIDGKFCNTEFQKIFSIEDLQKQWIPIVEELVQLHRSIVSSECFIRSFANLLKSESFDIVITEYFHSRLFTALGYLYNAPVIHVASLSPPWVSNDYGNPFNPAYIPHVFGGSSDRMNFMERLKNTIEVFLMVMTDELFLCRKVQEFADRYFDDIPPLKELMRNASLVLVNSHFTLSGPRPMVPNFVEIGGIHIKKMKALPQMYGQCFDGHFHKIPPQYQRLACDDKFCFKSHMFDKDCYRGKDLEFSEFVALPPLNCPRPFLFPLELKFKSNPQLIELQSEFTKQRIHPFLGALDSRTPVQFLLSFEEEIERKREPHDVSKIKLLILLKDVLFISLEEEKAMQYEDLRQRFLLEFWDMDKQFEICYEFEKSSHPGYEGQTVVEYVDYWLDRLNRCTTISPEKIIYDLMNRIPIRYSLHLSRLIPKCEEFIVEIRLIVRRCDTNLKIIVENEETKNN